MSEKLRLGGMALQNGILVHSPDHWAVAVRTPDGALRVASGEKPELPQALVEAPLVRGVVRIGELLALLPLIRLRVPEARLPMEGPVAGGALALSSLVGIAARRSRRLPPWLAETVAAGIGVVPALVSLRSSPVAGYHGAEHKAIGGYEHDVDAVDEAKEHERCGSHLVGPLVGASAVGNLAVRALPEEQRAAARVLAALAAVGVAVETFAWMGRNHDHPLARALRRPGHELQRVAATREPSPQELEVAEAALAEILRVEGRTAPPNG